MSLLDVLGSGEASSVSLVGQCHDSAKGLSGKWQLYPLSIFYIYFLEKALHSVWMLCNEVAVNITAAFLAPEISTMHFPPFTSVF